MREQVVEIMERHGLSVAGMAAIVGVSRQTVSNWTSGRTAPCAEVRDTLEHLHASPHYTRRRMRAEGVEVVAAAKHGVAWEPHEDAELLRCLEAGMTQRVIAEELGRSHGSVASRIKVLRREGVL